MKLWGNKRSVEADCKGTKEQFMDRKGDIEALNKVSVESECRLHLKSSAGLPPVALAVCKS